MNPADTTLERTLPWLAGALFLLPLLAHWPSGDSPPPGPPVTAADLEPQPLATPETWTTGPRGERFTTRRIRKVQGLVRRTGPSELSVGADARYVLVGEDAVSFQVRVEEPPPRVEPQALKPAPEPAFLSTAPAAAGARWHLAEVDLGLPTRGQWRHGFALGDMDGDGAMDVVHGPPRKGTPRPHAWVQRNGRLLPWTEVSWPAAPYDYGDAALADLDGDGRTDVALGVHYRGVMVLLQVERGRFQRVTEGLPDAEAQPGFSSRALDVVDVNGDGVTDVVALSDGPRAGAGTQPVRMGVTAFLARRDGKLRFEAAFSPADRLFGDDVAAWAAGGGVTILAASKRLDERAIQRTWKGGGLQVDAPLSLPGPHTLVEAVAWRGGEPVVAARWNDGGTWRGSLVLPQGVLKVDVPLLALGTDGDVIIGALEDGTVTGWRVEGQVAVQVFSVAAPAWAAGCTPQHVGVLTRPDAPRVLVVSWSGEGEAGCATGGGFTTWTMAPAAAR